MHITDYLYLEDLPLDCIEQIGRKTGAADELVNDWRQSLDFTVDPDNAREYIRSFGCYEDDELETMSQEDMANFILFEAGNSFYEQLQWNKQNPDKDPRDSDIGTDLICLAG